VRRSSSRVLRTFGFPGLALLVARTECSRAVTGGSPICQAALPRSRKRRRLLGRGRERRVCGGCGRRGS
jgi:hypothetical protein